MTTFKARIAISVDARKLTEQTVTIWIYERTGASERLVFLDSDQYLLHEALSLIRTAEGGYSDLAAFSQQIEKAGSGGIELTLKTSVLTREPGWIFSTRRIE
jgi:hypothetical protein